MSEPVSMTSRLPGDAQGEPSSSSSPPPPNARAAFTSSSTATPQAAPAARREARTVVLTSVSATDPSKRRDFEARYFHASSASDSASSSSARAFLDLPESYFQPTPSELQRAHAQAISHREQLVDRPLLTAKLRERTEAERNRAKAARWPQTRIRVRFADRSVVEGVFPSTDKLIHLYEFVRLALDPRVRSVPFVLYQSPPRTEYRKGDPAWRGKSLMDLQFTPSTSLYIKFEPPAEAIEGVDFDALNAVTPGEEWRPPLTEELLAAGGDLPLPPSFDPREQQKPETDAPPVASPASDEAQKKKDKEDRLRRLLGGGKKK
ncbi:hypothetical protein JCM8202_005000 [Rhodotorula sphaerocarpa]